MCYNIERDTGIGVSSSCRAEGGCIPKLRCDGLTGWADSGVPSNSSSGKKKGPRFRWQRSQRTTLNMENVYISREEKGNKGH